MSKLIRVDDTTHGALSRMALAQDRPIAAVVRRLVAAQPLPTGVTVGRVQTKVLEDGTTATGSVGGGTKCSHPLLRRSKGLCMACGVAVKG